MNDAGDRMSARFFVQAGLSAGMRVLDVGSGFGKVAAIAARLVGDDGEVLGIDRDASALAVARQQIGELGLGRVRFVEGDFRELGDAHGLFDAAVGRRVLMYQEDPVEALRRLATSVKPGGLIVFEEVDLSVPLASVALPLHEEVRSWLWQTLEREGARLHMGFDLFSVFVAAGLPAPEVRAEAVVQTPATRHPTATIVRFMMPRLLAQRVVTEAQVDLPTLDQRLGAEALERAGAAYIGDLCFAAWARRGEA